MKQIVYVPVYIEGKEENLPKDKNMPYICYFISNPDSGHLSWMQIKGNEGFWEMVTWWLKPVELPDEEECAIKFNEKVPYDSYYDTWIQCCKWIKSQILK